MPEWFVKTGDSERRVFFINQQIITYMITAKVVADSKNDFGNRLTTMVITFPRFILAELNTHRMMSRNSASSRAIPFEKMLKSVEENPFIPIAWQKDHKGMQGTVYLEDVEAENCEEQWLAARDKAVAVAIELSELGATKQLCNRLLEPFMNHTVIISATEWENFFHLRCPKYIAKAADEEFTCRSKKDMIKFFPLTKQFTSFEWLNLNAGQAEIHMMALAEAMWDAYNESTPKELKAGEWHIPFGDNIDKTELARIIRAGIAKDGEEAAWKIATARCARVSYTVVGEEGKPDNYENDIKLHDRLAASGHWSPFEHCAKVMSQYNIGEGSAEHMKWSGNFKGFVQYRKTFNNENVTK